MNALVIPLDSEQRRRLENRLAMILARLRAGLSITGRAMARMLGIAESTMRGLCRRGQRLLAGATRVARGRPPRATDRVSRHDILTVLHATAGRASVRQLKSAFAHVSRAEIRAVRDCYRRARARLTRHGGAVLQWHLPRAVWAADFTDFASGIEDQGRDVLIVRDLGSGATLSAEPEPPDAAHVCGTLARLIAAHGAPLVVKSDNGSCFLAEDTRLLLAVNQILGHLSPPGTPSYNGSCEAGVGSVKHRAVDFAQRRGPASPVTLDDLELARQQANAQPIDGGRTRSQLFEQAQPPSLELRLEVWARYRSWQLRLRRQHDIAPDAILPHPRQASLDRFAIGKALTETGILTIRRR